MLSKQKKTVRNVWNSATGHTSPSVAGKLTSVRNAWRDKDNKHTVTEPARIYFSSL